MEVIIKPTARCNFACTFCSADHADVQHSDHLPQLIADQLKVLKPCSVIVTGGDPLCVSPSYFSELLEVGDFNISLTTNLKGFVLEPQKWEELFKNQRVRVCTSFQYGEGRQWSPGVPYTEAMFIDTMQLFANRIGYVPYFISIISQDNESRALDHLRLAKRLGTKCKLNAMLDLGLSQSTYPFYKMVDIWLAAEHECLSEWHNNTIQLKYGGCCFNTNGLCQSTIRAMWIANDGSLKYGNCEDMLLLGSQIPVDTAQPTASATNLADAISPRCYTCELCRLCNSCRSQRRANAKDQHFCEEMLKRKEQILDSGWNI